MTLGSPQAPPPRPPEQPPAAAWRVALALIFLLALALRGALLTRPLAALDGRTLPDDAYISLYLAKNIGLGLGPRFGDDFTNGFQPLYVWLMALPAALLGPEALTTVEGLDQLTKIGLGLGAAADLAALTLVALLLYRSGYPRAAVFAALLWALHPAALATAFNGLETSLALLALAAIWALHRQGRDAAPGRRLRLGLLIGVGALARIDLLLLGVFFGLSGLLQLRRRPPRSWLLGNLALALGVALGFAPWLLYSLYYTGRWYPISGQAVRFLSMVGVDRRHMWPHYRYMLGEAARALSDALPYLRWAALAAFAGLLVALALSARRRGRPAFTRLYAAAELLALPVVFCLTLVVAYTFYIFCPWYFGRYLAPLTVLAFVVLGVALELLLRALPRRPPLQLTIYALALAAALAPLKDSPPGLEALFVKRPNARLGYRNLGLWTRKHLPAGERVGAPQSGALAYYGAHIEVINLDGVVNAAAFRALKRRRMLDYIRANKITTLIGWQQNLDLLAIHSQNFSSYEWTKVRTIKGFRSWGHPWLVYKVNPPADE